MRRIFATLIPLLISTLPSLAQVNLSFVRSSVPMLDYSSSVATIHWPEDAGVTPWSANHTGAGRFTIDAAAHTYQPANFSPGQVYEFAYKKFSYPLNSYRTLAGHLSYGVEVPLRDLPGGCLLLCEETLANAAGPELAAYQRELEADGWRVWLRTVQSTAAATAVRGVISTVAASDTSLSHIILVGHVPVPYSGSKSFYPDGHKSHEGPWACDGYYADAASPQSVWPDTASFVPTLPSLTGKANEPNDGRFDRNTYPSVLEYCVGRLDFSDLPTLGTPGTSPLEQELFLLRRYLEKRTAYRQGKLDLRKTVVMHDTLATLDDGPGKGAYRSYGPALGAGAFVVENWLNNPSPALAGVMTSFGEVSNGRFSFTYAASVEQIAAGQVNTVFNHLFGSYFGDWDNKDNLLRASIAGPGIGLCALWDGRPSYSLHSMGIGYSIGHAVRFSSWLNLADGYDPGIGNKGVHMGLMGDPTLTLFPVKPPSHAIASLTGTYAAPEVALTWSAPVLQTSEAPLAGYHIFRSAGPGQPFQRITAAPITATNFSEPLASTKHRYQVKSVRLETTPSGSFWNASLAENAPLVAGSIELVELWRREHFGSNAANVQDTGDEDGDGCQNLLEFALGSNPSVANTLDFGLALSQGQMEVSYLEPMQCSAPLVLQVSSDLTNWQPVVPSGVADANPGWCCRLHCLPTATAGARRYFRLSTGP